MPRPYIDVLEAQAEASGAALLAVGADGEILRYNEKLRSDWVIPEPILSGSIAPLIDWLKARDGECERAIVELLTADDPPSAGDRSFASRQAFTFRSVELRGGRGRVWAFRDVSEREHLEAGLRDAGYLLRILESHVDGVVLELDTNARIVGIWASNDSPYFETPDAAVPGRPILDAIGGTQGATLESLVRTVFETKQPRLVEYSLDIHGEPRVFAADVRFMPGSEGEPSRVTVMIRDITERSRMQTQLLEAERLASVGLLAAGVAHEINNPLAYTLLNLERIQRGLRDLVRGTSSDLLNELLDGVALSLEGGRRVQAIINDLRRFSRSDRGEANMPIDVRRVIDFAIEMVGHEIRDRARVVREFGEVPLVAASENRLSQIFLNLIVNAAHSIEVGAPEENEIRVVTTTDPTGHALIEVHDTGEGMTTSVMQRIFEPFYTTKPAGTGTGLGLAICHGIATSLGGKLSVESERGRGSVFRLLLPPLGLGGD